MIGMSIVNGILTGFMAWDMPFSEPWSFRPGTFFVRKPCLITGGVLMHHWINWIALREHEKTTKKRKPLHLIIKPYGFL
jgi:hypothetical protein